MANIYILSGVSGSGKSTIGDLLIKRHSNLARSVTLTTRKPREGEKYGLHYFFVTEEIFLWLLKTEQLLEHTHLYGGTYYGTLRLSVDELVNSGKDVLFVVDIKGVLQISKYLPQAKSVFLTAPNDEELRRRIGEREMTQVELERRFEVAREEREWAERHKVPIVVNDDLETAYQEVEKLFLIENF